MIRYEYEKKRGRKGYIKQKLISLIAPHMPHPGIRAWLYRKMGVHIGRGVFIAINCYIDDNFPELVHIEDGAGIGTHSIIVCHDDTTATVKSIKICKRVYIGAGSIILPGTTIGEYAVIGAGSVVKGEIPPHSLAVGSPAKVIGKADPEKYIWLKGDSEVYSRPGRF